MRLKDIELIFHEELDAIYEIDEVKNFFLLLVEKYYSFSRLDLALDINLSITEKEQGLINSALSDLKKEKPIQYILGETEFFGLPFKVNKNVLIPRPETEELIDWVLDEVKSRNKRSKSSGLSILDIGTGSGCIAISLAKNIPDSIVYALDISQNALYLAKQNAELNEVEINIIPLDILNPETWIQNFKDLKFDIIVSNPPYVRMKEIKYMKANVIQNEPHIALFVEDENPLLFYKAITAFSVNNLNLYGILFFEINEYLGEEIVELLKEIDFENIELKKDIFDKDRFVKAVKPS